MIPLPESVEQGVARIGQHRVPTGLPLTHTLWVPPGKLLAERALTKSRKRRRTESEMQFLSVLRDAWKERHKPIQHSAIIGLGKVVYPKARISEYHRLHPSPRESPNDPRVTPI